MPTTVAAADPTPSAGVTDVQPGGTVTDGTAESQDASAADETTADPDTSTSGDKTGGETGDKTGGETDDNADDNAADEAAGVDAGDRAEDTPTRKPRTVARADGDSPVMLDVEKSNNDADKILRPGDQMVYRIFAGCSSNLVDCIDFTLTDVLPAGLEVTSLPSSTSTRLVAYDVGTRTLTVTYRRPLQNPPDELGMQAGTNETFEIGVRLPADTDLADGVEITNRVDATADNAPDAFDDDKVTVEIPKVVKPVATKAWTDGAAIAGGGEASVIKLGVRNASSSSAEVTSLSVTDDSTATFESFDFTGAEVTAMPAGADRARLLVCTEALSACADADYQPGPWRTGVGALALPGGVPTGSVTGVRVVFEEAGGAVLPPDATGGTVELGMKLRDTVRSTGAAIKPATRQAVRNCAAPTALDSGDATDGAEVCASYDILPDRIIVTPTKTFFPDTNGNWTKDNYEYAVVGTESPVSAVVDAENESYFPLRELKIIEPDPGAVASEFDKVDVSRIRLRFPTGATAAQVKITYADATTATPAAALPGPVTLDIAKAGTRVTSIEVTYTGVDGDNEPSIAEGSIAGLDLHGTLRTGPGGVTDDDLMVDGSTSPGVVNCAAYQAKADTTDGNGSAAGSACATLTVEAPRTTVMGVKTVGQTSVPPGQPIPFTLKMTNNGNLPLVNPVMTDPRVDVDDQPLAADNPFAILRLTSATVTKDTGTPAATITVYDPSAGGGAGAWVAYDDADAGLLTRATGVRVALAGELAPGKAFQLDLTGERRDGVVDGVSVENCFLPTAQNLTSSTPACAPEITTGPVDASAFLHKDISPSTLIRPVLGMDPQTATVQLRVSNDGNLSASQLQVVDNDADFFDAVDFGAITAVTFPVGSNRVRIDAYVDGAWVNGAVRAPGASYPLPTGVTAGQVRGIRAVFTANVGGFPLRPCGTSTCEGRVSFTVSPRIELHSTDDPVPAMLQDTVGGFFQTRLNDDDDLVAIPDDSATLNLEEGTPKLDVDKTPDSAIAPGETAPFSLTLKNTGTAFITDPVVKDLLPPGLAFDETFSGDGGLPYEITGVDVPAGADLPPTPDFATLPDGDRIGAVSWTFTGWAMAPGSELTIQIQATLEPGVVEGQQIDNLMGATSPTPGLTCEATDPVMTDGALGDGSWCTDTAKVVTKAGAAFQARKWVAGTDGLGWWNGRTSEHVAVGDASCPVATFAGSRYTAYPCVALVNPGDTFDYVLRLANAGTQPGTDMRIIDRLPVSGDRAVIVNNGRGTEWSNRPVLVSEPTLLAGSAGTLTNSYSTTEPLCTDDLSMTGGTCAGAWTDPFGEDVVGVQMRVHWDTPLAPGAGVSIAFSMRTPIDVPQVSSPTVAWNSYAHNEITLRGDNTPQVLRPQEPIQVGVATAYGALRLTKTLGANPGGLDLDQGYGFAYRCTIPDPDPDPGQDPDAEPVIEVASGTRTVTPGTPVDVTGIPAGATCKVWESDSKGGVSTHPAGDPVVVTIDPMLQADDPVSTASIENSFPLRTLQVGKEVDGDAASYGDVDYDLTVQCRYNGVVVDGFPVTVTVRGGEQEPVDAPAGAVCEVTEQNAHGATETDLPDPLTVGTQNPALTVTNTFRGGHLQVLKEIRGEGGDLPKGPFEFSVQCVFDGSPLDPIPLTIPRSGSDRDLVATVDQLLPVGAECTVTETDDGGADATPAPVTVTIAETQANGDIPANTVRATFTNEFSAGTLTLHKVLEGAGKDLGYVTDATFTVVVRCAVDDPANLVFSRDVAIKGGESLTMQDVAGTDVRLPLGSHCWAEETGTGGATSHTVDRDSWDNAAIVTSGDPSSLQALEITATNTFDLASISLTKTVTGEAASYAEGRHYQIAVTCTLRQGTTTTTVLDAQPHRLGAGQTVTIEDLPVGAQCWASETDDGGATTVVVDHAAPATALAVPADGSGAIVVTNDFAAGELSVTKEVEGEGSGPFHFTLRCRTDLGPVTLRDKDAEFTLGAGKTRTFSLPLGATCTVREVDVPDRVLEVAYADSTGRNDGKVTVGTAASVVVTNTFPAGTSPENDNRGDNSPATAGLPGTGGPALGLLGLALALLAGGAVLLRRRRS